MTLIAPSSLAAANRTTVTAIADGSLFSINFDTGAATQRFAIAGGALPGEFSLETAFHTYGPDGLLYVLDYGNGRVQSLDPAAAFAPVGEIALQSGVTTANMQFAIGPTGNLYLGDGLGGGSSYAADGTFLGAFSLPGTVTGITPRAGSQFYLSTDATGGVYAFDTTGFHQYADASVVPEPGASALVLGSVAAILVLRRRQRERQNYDTDSQKLP